MPVKYVESLLVVKMLIKSVVLESFIVSSVFPGYLQSINQSFKTSIEPVSSGLQSSRVLGPWSKQKKPDQDCFGVKLCIVLNVSEYLLIKM